MSNDIISTFSFSIGISNSSIVSISSILIPFFVSFFLAIILIPFFVSLIDTV
nr:MAG TPA: hypothetical protein [Caudoviricetes sp.]